MCVAHLTIHRLTLVTIFLAVPTLVASLYGMNVPLPIQEKKGYVTSSQRSGSSLSHRPVASEK